jgi:hypothetical protein
MVTLNGFAALHPEASCIGQITPVPDNRSLPLSLSLHVQVSQEELKVEANNQKCRPMKTRIISKTKSQSGQPQVFTRSLLYPVSYKRHPVSVQKPEPAKASSTQFLYKRHPGFCTRTHHVSCGVVLLLQSQKMKHLTKLFKKKELSYEPFGDEEVQTDLGDVGWFTIQTWRGQMGATLYRPCPGA